MSSITTSVELKEAIQFLELEREIQKQSLNENYQSIFSAFQPSNLIKSSLGLSKSTDLLIDQIIDTSLGAVVGYITKKLIVGKSNNKFRILLGSIVQTGVLNVIAKHHSLIKSFVENLLQSVLPPKK